MNEVLTAEDHRDEMPARQAAGINPKRVSILRFVK